MSQQQMVVPGTAPDAVDEYDAAFDSALETEELAFDEVQQQNTQPATAPSQPAPQPVPPQPQPTYEPQPQPQPQVQQAQQPVYQPQPQPQQQQQPQAQAPKQIELPDELKDEWEQLKAASPEAAALALEDTPEGEQVRSRLREYGNDLAFDRADAILSKRHNLAQRQTDERLRTHQAIQAHNAHFTRVLQHDHPQYMALMQDPNRRAEAQALVQDVYRWIASLPYAEAAPMMTVAKTGRDPQQISAVLTRYYAARGNARTAAPGPIAGHRIDPTGAFAVPTRGGGNVSPGVIDPDDFDAAFDAAISSEK